MLVVKKVILPFLNKVAKIMHFKNKNPVSFKKCFHPQCYIVHIVNMRKDIIGKNSVSLSVSTRHSSTNCFSKIVNHRIYSLRLCDFGHVFSWVYSQNSHSQTFKRRE